MNDFDRKAGRRRGPNGRKRGIRGRRGRAKWGSGRQNVSQMALGRGEKGKRSFDRGHRPRTRKNKDRETPTPAEVPVRKALSRYPRSRIAIPATVPPRRRARARRRPAARLAVVVVRGHARNRPSPFAVAGACSRFVRRAESCGRTDIGRISPVLSPCLGLGDGLHTSNTGFREGWQRASRRLTTSGFVARCAGAANRETTAPRPGGTR